MSIGAGSGYRQIPANEEPEWDEPRRGNQPQDRYFSAVISGARRVWPALTPAVFLAMGETVAHSLRYSHAAMAAASLLLLAGCAGVHIENPERTKLSNEIVEEAKKVDPNEIAGTAKKNLTEMLNQEKAASAKSWNKQAHDELWAIIADPRPLSTTFLDSHGRGSCAHPGQIDQAIPQRVDQRLCYLTGTLSPDKNLQHQDIDSSAFKESAESSARGLALAGYKVPACVREKEPGAQPEEKYVTRADRKASLLKQIGAEYAEWREACLNYLDAADAVSMKLATANSALSVAQAELKSLAEKIERQKKEAETQETAVNALPEETKKADAGKEKKGEPAEEDGEDKKKTALENTNKLAKDLQGAVDGAAGIINPFYARFITEKRLKEIDNFLDALKTDKNPDLTKLSPDEARAAQAIRGFALLDQAAKDLKEKMNAPSLSQVHFLREQMTLQLEIINKRIANLMREVEVRKALTRSLRAEAMTLIRIKQRPWKDKLDTSYEAAHAKYAKAASVGDLYITNRAILEYAQSIAIDRSQSDGLMYQLLDLRYQASADESAIVLQQWHQLLTAIADENAAYDKNSIDKTELAKTLFNVMSLTAIAVGVNNQ